MDNSSLVELEPLRMRPEANVTIVFTTTQENGVLLYDGQNGDHIAVELFNGRVRVSYDVGNYPTSTMYSYEMIADGKPHVAELLAIKKNFTMRVDRGPARSIINEGPKEYLKLITPMYVGGVAPEVANIAFTEFHLRNITSFQGKPRVENWLSDRVKYMNVFLEWFYLTCTEFFVYDIYIYIFFLLGYLPYIWNLN